MPFVYFIYVSEVGYAYCTYFNIVSRGRGTYIAAVKECKTQLLGVLCGSCRYCGSDGTFGRRIYCRRVYAYISFCGNKIAELYMEPGVVLNTSPHDNPTSNSSSSE